jgi:hypothetical protein
MDSGLDASCRPGDDVERDGSLDVKRAAPSLPRTARGAQLVLRDLQVDAELACAVSAFFGLEAHFLIETTGDLAFDFFQVAIAPRFELRWFDYH